MEKSPSKEIKLAVLVLAAGAGTRMGEIKQLLPYGEKNLLTHALDEALASDVQHVFCVLGARAETITNQIQKTFGRFEKVNWIINPDWEKGMGSSVAAGVDQITTKMDFDGLLIVLADQPLVDQMYLNRLIASFRKNPERIVASDYGGKIGVPAVFPKAYFDHLGKLEGDTGARKLLNDPKIENLAIAVKEKLMDVDTPEDYQKIITGRYNHD